MKLIRWSAVALLAVLMGAWGAAWVLRAPGEGIADSFARNLARVMGGQDSVPNAGGLVLPAGVEVGGPFALTDHNGREVTNETYRGKWMLVFFGFTFCPDICPTTLQALAAARRELGADAKDVQVIFVTIDPQRDTPQAMKEYLESAGLPEAIGLTGTPEQIAAVAKAYRIYYAKAGEGDDYTMDHSTLAYLMNPQGLFEAPLPYALSPTQKAQIIRDAMQQGR